MIINLHVRNLALISEVDVDFKEGLNILTGETGAGKSMIIGSVNLALGAKADKEMIRTGAEYALVELAFHVETKEQKEILQKMELQADDDGNIVLQRKIMPNRNVCKICGESVTGTQLKELAPYFLDMYGQHDHQTLLQAQKHLDILDSFGSKELISTKETVKELFQHYQDALSEMQELQMDQTQRDKELSFAEFELHEIEEAALEVGEDSALENDFFKLQNAYKIKEHLILLQNLLKEKDDSCTEQLGRAVKELSYIQNFDAKLQEYMQNICEIEDMLHDFLREIQNYDAELSFSQEDFDVIQARLNVINHLKDKYGSDISDILTYAEKLSGRIDQLRHLEENRLAMQERLDLATKQLEAASQRLSLLRKKEAQKLEKEIQAALSDLNFLNSEFVISFTERENYTSQGKDRVEFLISTNFGEPVKPLRNVASGGELSRIMLAIKTVSAARDAINTLIFDEIDTGISGKTAWKVSEKLGMLARNHQIICITHLPQIAAMADSHYVIEKDIQSSVTVTTLRELSDDEMMTEVARLIGGETITESAMEHARELKELATKTKK